MKRIFSLLLIASAFLFSCKKDENTVTTNNNITPSEGDCYIINEGTFQNGNTSISYYNTRSGNVIANMFQQANNRPLGDLCQSITEMNGKLYIVVNNSGKIEVCDKTTLVSTATITGFTSPRYIVQVNTHKAYVSDLFGGALKILDLTTNTISGSIPLSGDTEEMILEDGKVYVTNYFKPYLFVIDTATNSVSDSIPVAMGGMSITKDNNDLLWVLCSGEYQVSPGAIHKINPVNKQVLATMNFTMSDSPLRIRANSSGNEIYFIKGDVYKLNSTAVSLPSSPFIPANGRSFYGLRIISNGIIHVSDAIDFMQTGRVYRYGSDGSMLNSFSTGIAPSDFFFF